MRPLAVSCSETLMVPEIVPACTRITGVSVVFGGRVRVKMRPSGGELHLRIVRISRVQDLVHNYRIRAIRQRLYVYSVVHTIGAGYCGWRRRCDADQHYRDLH